MNKDTSDTRLLHLAAELVHQAGSTILAIRARGFAVDRKDDQSPVTEADRTAEALIVQGLRQTAPHIPVIAEEEIAAGLQMAATDEYWLVDPLDGTREFAAGRDDFTVNIGLIRHGRPVLGAVGLPAYGELFTGLAGHGAWKRDQAGERRIRARQPPAEGLTVMASRHYASDPQIAEFLHGRSVAQVHNIGSAVKFCRVAEGAADLYPRFGTTMEWDTAAPQAVLEAAGGTLCLFDGTPMPYGKPDWKNPPFICTGLQ